VAGVSMRLLRTALLMVAVLAAPADASSTVYKWVDEYGTVHLSTSKPPAGVAYQTLNLGSSARSGSKSAAAGGSAGSKAPAASPAQAAQRSDVLASLQNRECVIALEALDRLTSGTRPTDADEITRLKQTADLNCSKDPARRREQEDMAAKLRVANGPECVAARNKLADMMAAGSKATRDEVQAQRAFVDGHCIPPVQ
jgi:hypothetical protein